MDSQNIQHLHNGIFVGLMVCIGNLSDYEHVLVFYLLCGVATHIAFSLKNFHCKGAKYYMNSNARSYGRFIFFLPPKNSLSRVKYGKKKGTINQAPLQIPNYKQQKTIAI
jgi:hypothetical protein